MGSDLYSRAMKHPQYAYSAELWPSTIFHVEVSECDVWKVMMYLKCCCSATRGAVGWCWCGKKASPKGEHRSATKLLLHKNYEDSFVIFGEIFL